MKDAALNALSPKFKLIWTAILIIFLSVQNIFGWEPSPELTGKWQGKSEVFAAFKKGEYPSHVPADSILLVLKINPDGLVEGQVGEAKLVNCRIEKNRGWFGRMLHIKTDFIITDGKISGKIAAGDMETERSFTLPFNIVNGELTGSVMILRPWTYPEPMFPRVKLKKVL
jgi:hypothetical protein